MEYYLAEGVACRVTARVFDHFPIKWDVMSHQLWYGISDGTALESLIGTVVGVSLFYTMRVAPSCLIRAMAT